MARFFGLAFAMILSISVAQEVAQDNSGLSWGVWGQWEICDYPLNDGQTSTRRRVCLSSITNIEVKRKRCIEAKNGTNVEEMPCTELTSDRPYHGEPVEWQEWQEWSKCKNNEQKRSRLCGRALDRSIWPRTECKKLPDNCCTTHQLSEILELISENGDSDSYIESRLCESEDITKVKQKGSSIYEVYKSSSDIMRIKAYRGLSGLSHPFCEYFPDQGIPPNPRIVSNVWKMTFEHLIMISLVGKGEHGQICSGSIFHSRYILTAGHCFVGWNTDPSSYEVIVRFRSSGFQEVHKLTSINCHEEYQASSETILNDICILKTEEEIQFSNDVWPICLPEPSNTDSSECLESAGISVQNDDNCSNSYSPEQHYCGELDESDKTGFLTCDSGMPYESRYDRRNPNTLAGIVSYSSSSSQEKNPAVFTNINHFLPWIFDQIYKYDDCYPENPCLNGICTDKLFGHECVCFEGWMEDDCSMRVEDKNKCYKNACRNGECVLDDTSWKGYKCKCDYGYGGPFCNIIDDPCVTINCSSGECKIDENGQPRCACPVNKTGVFCNLDLIE